MKYKTRLRSRISNLKDQKNPDLRRNVLCGNISPQRIACMTAEVSVSHCLLQREAVVLGMEAGDAAQCKCPIPAVTLLYIPLI